MNHVLMFLGGLLIVAFAALFAVPAMVDWNGYRGVFEEEASRILGREVRVGGNVALRLLPSPYVRFEKLRIADPGGETGRPLIRVDDFIMRLSVPPLLKGLLEAREIELTKPVLELAVDGDGIGNWASLGIKSGELPFVPNGIALQSVRIIDGAIGFSGSKGNELARLDAINGELSADALEGPFRFKGTVKWNGEDRDTRLTTTARQANGDFRFKAVVNAPATGNAYVLDATASDLAGSPRVAGELSGKLSVKSWQITAPAAEPAGKQAAPVPQFDFKAKLASDARQAKLSDIAITLEQGGPPQLISGEATVGWSERVKLDTTLTSKWLDLDQLTSGGSAEAAAGIPLDVAREFFERFVGLMPNEADTTAAFVLDQIGLGKQVISGLRITVARAGGPLQVRDVRANLPGGTELSLDGTLTEAGGERAFDGTIALNGQSLTRFASWGFGDTSFGRQRTDGPFSLSGQMLLSDSAVELKDATAEANGTPLRGGVRLTLKGARQIAVKLEGKRIDLAQLWPESSGLDGLKALLFKQSAQSKPDANGATATPGTQDAAFSDLSLNVKAGELIDGSRTLKDVHAELTLVDGKLTMPVLKFSSTGGLLVDLEGDALGLPEKPRGTVRGVIEAPEPAAVEALSELIGVSQDFAAVRDRWARMSPWRLATTLGFGERLDKALDLTMDGVVRGGRLVMSARIDGAGPAWREAPADLTAEIETADIDAILATVSPQQKGRRPAATTAQQPGRVYLKAVGIPATGLVSVAEVTTEGLETDFTGHIKIGEAQDFAADGNIKIAASDIRRPMGLMGIDIGRAATGVAVEGTIAAKHAKSTLTLTSQNLKVGASKLTGTMVVASGDAGRTAVTADLTADQVNLPGLLPAVLSDAASGTEVKLPTAPPPVPTTRRQAALLAAQAAALAAEPAPVWPDQAFDLSVLNALDGTIKANIRSLSLEPGLAMQDARLAMTLAPGRVEVTSLEGAALGGKAVSKWTLETQPAGALLNGDLKIGISSRGSAESGSDDSIESDVAALDVKFSGKALSPLAMMAAMSGTGTMKLGDVTLSGVSPEAVSSVSEQVLAGKGAMPGAELSEALSAALKQYQLKLGQVTIPVIIGDGALKLAKVEVQTKDGTAVFDTTVNLQKLTLDSAWKIAGKAASRAAPSTPVPPSGAPVAAAAGERKPLPDVIIAYTGRLKDVGQIPPTINAEALERELNVRRMERDVDELERLRKLDQQRAREEQDRLKAADAARAAAAQLEAAKAAEAAQTAAPAGPDGAPLPDQGVAPPATVPAETGAAPAAGGEVPQAEADPVQSEPGKTDPPRVTAPRRKKPVENTWKPFQVSPYQ